jgi:hypothetical protein
MRLAPALFLCVLCALCGPAPAFSDGFDELALEFTVSGKRVAAKPLAELKKALKSHRIEYRDPFLQKTKHYEAFALKDVLELAFGARWKEPAYSDVIFRALDGYESVGPLEKLKEDGPYLAFADLDEPAGSWEPIGMHKADPGPFYLVWTGPDQNVEHQYPWPWQVESIRLVEFKDQYPRVFPKGAAEDSPAYKGFLTFKGRCMRCHSISREGGKIGPDLNAPKSVVEYRSTDMIKEFIRHPSQYRYTYMPDHPDLTDENLDQLIEYFRFESRRN